MSEALKNLLYEKGAHIVRFVDISSLPSQANRGFPRAILFCMGLSKKFVMDIYNSKPVDKDEFLLKEVQVEALADWLEEYLRSQGWRASSQSEAANRRNGYIERGYIVPELEQGISTVPQKTLGRLAGLGFIGKNNLLITQQYGSAFSMCSVLTDRPLICENREPLAEQCGECEVCIKVCPGMALQGNTWREAGGREALIDVSKCMCPLKCMVTCPWTLRYATR